MLDSIVSSSKSVVLEKALVGSAMRHKALSDNIANVNTPGFKRSDVQFSDALQEAIDSGKGQRMTLATTRAGHLSAGRNGSFGFSVQQMGNTTIRNDGNNVDIDIEMAEMAKNNLYYNAVAQDLGRYFTQLKSVINGGK